MAILTVRNVPDEVHRALRLRAASSGRSTEAEVRAILEAAVKPSRACAWATRLRMGDALAALGRKTGLTDAELDAIGKVRDKRAAKPMKLA